MQKPWLNSYPDGIPTTIDSAASGTVVDIFEAAVASYPDKTAYSNLGNSLTYAELDQHTRAFAAWLAHETPLEPGDRVALMMPNLLQYPVALFGALRAGMVVVNTNPLYTGRELRHQLQDSGARAIVVVENFAHVLADVIGDTKVETVVTTRVGNMLKFPKSLIVDLVLKYVKKQVPAFDLPRATPFNKVLGDGAGLAFERASVQPADLAFLQYTGGTTGRAKGAELTHANIASNVAQASAWLKNTIIAGDEIIVTALPLYHIFALTANCMTYLQAGAHNVLITNPRDMPAFVKELAQHKFTAITGVNTLFNGLLNTPGFDALDFSALRATLGGGMAVQGAVARRWKSVTGHTLVEAYGLTETSPAACINPMDLAEYNGSIGLPVPSTEVRVIGDDGAPLPLGEVGELCIRGPQVMRGYWQRPEDTAAVLDADGWLRTGDVARIDEDGFVFIVDRKKDMIIVSGFNVYPNEVEDVVADHPGVLEVGAIGVADERSGEVVKVIIVRKDPNLTEADIEAHCRENLTNYKRPRHVEFTSELPKTNVGKILRRELREQFGK